MSANKQKNDNQPVLSSSMEDYLEAILDVEKDKKKVRVRDVARKLDVTLPSVTEAIKNLEREGMVLHEKYEGIELTKQGRKRASDIARRHEVLRTFLKEILGLDGTQAEETACVMEHKLTVETIDGLIALSEFIQVCPGVSPKWRKYRRGFRQTASGVNAKDFLRCLNEQESLDLITMITDDGGGNILEETTLDRLEVNQSGIVTHLRGRGPVRRRLTEMGIVRGAVLIVERVALFNGPIEIRTRGYYLSLRGSEANLISVRPIADI